MKKTVLVTGSSKNLGAAIVRKYASSGYNVVINYKTNKEKAIELKEEVENKYNVKALTICCDVSKEEEVKKMFDTIIQEFNSIDVVVNNAAIEICSELDKKNHETFRRVFDVNVIGTFLICKIFGTYMKGQKKGNIINISSNNAINKYSPSTMEYDASKSAVINMSLNFAKEFSPFVNVNVVAPGWIETDDIIKLDKELDNKFISSESDKILLKRFAKPEEIANVIYFLSTDDASYINGSVIRVDGGSNV